jgi:hypothetical protein
MSADSGHFEPRSGSLNTILELDHLRTIDDMFAILAYWFQEKSSPLKPVSQFKANMTWMVLKWSIFKIVSGDPDLHPRWPLQRT